MDKPIVVYKELPLSNRKERTTGICNTDDFKTIMLSKGSQTQKSICYVIPFNEILEQVKRIFSIRSQISDCL